MQLKHLNIKPKVFPSYLRRKRKRLALIEPRFSKHNGLCFGPKWLAWLNGQWESVLRVSAWVSKGQQMQWKWTPFLMETKEKKNFLIQLWSCLYDYMWKWTLVCTVMITSIYGLLKHVRDKFFSLFVEMIKLFLVNNKL